MWPQVLAQSDFPQHNHLYLTLPLCIFLFFSYIDVKFTHKIGKFMMLYWKSLIYNANVDCNSLWVNMGCIVKNTII